MGMIRMGRYAARKSMRAGRNKYTSTRDINNPYNPGMSDFEEKYGPLILGVLLAGVGILFLLSLIFG